jgi:hypothetical protein
LAGDFVSIIIKHKLNTKTLFSLPTKECGFEQDILPFVYSLAT